MLNKLFSWLWPQKDDSPKSHRLNKEVTDADQPTIQEEHAANDTDLIFYTINNVYQRLSDTGLAHHFEEIKKQLKSRIQLTLEPLNDDELKLGQTKIGGIPDLYISTEWPVTRAGKSMSFIGQINCAEMAAADKSGMLPRTGLLSFFYCADQEAWGFNPEDSDRFKVLFTTELNGLQQRDFPVDLEPHSIFEANYVIATSCLSLPNWESNHIKGLLTDKELDVYLEFSEGYGNQMLGYADCIQGTMELECQLVTNGLYCGDASGYNDPKRRELEKGVEDWVLLLQVDSEEEKTGMMWGDLGRLYFWIRSQDLKEKRFDKAWCILQCY